MRKYISVLITGLLVTGAGLVVVALFKPNHNSIDLQALASRGHRMGASLPEVTIVEFSDFQCQYCAQAQPTLRQIRRLHPETVAIVYRHALPEGTGHHSYQAALASECAADQGRFEPFHDALFHLQDSIGRLPWEEFARRANLPSTPAFRQCLQSARFAPRVDEDLAEARALSLAGTPAFIINGKVLVGAPKSEALEREVQAALARARGPEQ